MRGRDWAGQVLKQSRLEAVFLTNDFDDPLQGFDTKLYIPCLRTDDLVFHLTRPEVAPGWKKPPAARARAAELAQGIGKLFEHFSGHGAGRARFVATRFSPAKVRRGGRRGLRGNLVAGR